MDELGRKYPGWISEAPRPFLCLSEDGANYSLYFMSHLYKALSSPLRIQTCHLWLKFFSSTIFVLQCIQTPKRTRFTLSHSIFIFLNLLFCANRRLGWYPNVNGGRVSCKEHNVVPGYTKPGSQFESVQPCLYLPTIKLLLSTAYTQFNITCDEWGDPFEHLCEAGSGEIAQGDLSSVLLQSTLDVNIWAEASGKAIRHRSPISL